MQNTVKEEIVKKFQSHAQDSGSAPVQVALLTHRIEQLSNHLKSHRKDHSSRYGLIKMVSARRKLLNYLQRAEQQRYQEVIEALKLRR